MKIDKEQKITVNDLLTEDSIREAIGKFVDEEMAKAKSLILIWTDDWGMHTRVRNLNELEAIGLLEEIKAMCVNDDLGETEEE